MDLLSAPTALTVFIATIGISLYALYKDPTIFNRFLLHPYSIKNRNTYYMLITSGFLHADISHLLFNMFTYFFFAFALEQMIGPAEFLITYFGAMMLSDIPTVFKKQDDYGYSAVGASGAISGILFAFILYQPQSAMGVFLIPIRIPAPIFGVLYLAYCYFAAKRDDRVNHDAHFWGAVAGILITVILNPEVVPYFLENIF